jgi:hypothetical protein
MPKLKYVPKDPKTVRPKPVENPPPGWDDDDTKDKEEKNE